MSLEELEGSELGTKDYWDHCYQREINNYKNHGDVGEIWFDEDSQIRVINWLLKCDDVEIHDRLIDLGCGNGMMLIELAREGYSNLTGTDYSKHATELAAKIALDQELSITYKTLDILTNDILELGVFKVVHDKGNTFLNFEKYIMKNLKMYQQLYRYLRRYQSQS